MPDAPHRPVVAFGLYAMAVALKAKSGQLRVLDRLGLAERALSWCHADDAPCLAALRFLDACYDANRVVSAGQDLLEFLSAWLDGLNIPQTEAVLKEVADAPLFRSDARPVKHVSEPVAEPHAERHFDWQDRADAGLGGE